MTSYAVVDGSGIVINMIVWDGVSDWSPSSGCVVVLDDGTAMIGGRWNGHYFEPVAS